ncbi:hypothetical protein D3C81_2135640 [compost metagenome]
MYAKIVTTVELTILPYNKLGFLPINIIKPAMNNAIDVRYKKIPSFGVLYNLEEITKAQIRYAEV